MSAGSGTSPPPSTGLPTADIIRARLDEVRARIAAAGRDPESVTIVGVTKTFPPELTTAALSAGLVHLGENYAQDLEAKAAHAATLGLAPVWHFIGGLQRNKVKRLAGAVGLWETVDRSSLVAELVKRDPGARILLQVNTTGEEQKSGCRPGEVQALADEAATAGLVVEGLMTVGPTGGGDPRPAFESLAALGQSLGTTTLSMGMSGDFEAAVACGATMVRLGSVLFGARRAG